MVKRKGKFDETALQSLIVDGEKMRRPDALISGTPYMNRSTIGKSKKLGYTKGWPDVVDIDPRFEVRRTEDAIKIRFHPAMIFEVKSPNGKGKVQPEQRAIHQNMMKRGCLVFIPENYADAREVSEVYHSLQPYYDGWITIYRKSGRIVPPKRPKDIVSLHNVKRKILLPTNLVRRRGKYKIKKTRKTGKRKKKLVIEID